jgi:hypothetical protein
MDIMPSDEAIFCGRLIIDTRPTVWHHIALSKRRDWEDVPICSTIKSERPCTPLIFDSRRCSDVLKLILPMFETMHI